MGKRKKKKQVSRDSSSGVETLLLGITESISQKKDQTEEKTAKNTEKPRQDPERRPVLHQTRIYTREQSPKPQFAKTIREIRAFVNGSEWLSARTPSAVYVEARVGL